MKLVNNEEELETSLSLAKQEAMKYFLNDEVYIEKYFTSPRHIEVQIMADSAGNVLAFGERECSIQRRHQKILEESPSPGINEKIRKEMCLKAIDAAKSVNYLGAGTIEFLYDDKAESFYFMEMNTRIQVEHPVTEFVTGVDLLKYQILVHADLTLPEYLKNIKLRGHSIECRINAENPDKNFMPSPGKITDLHFPGGMGVRVDSFIYAGYTIPSNYDSMIAKIIVHAPTRIEAIQRMLGALDECKIEGIFTNIDYHKKILKNGSFINGDINTNFLNSFL